MIPVCKNKIYLVLVVFNLAGPHVVYSCCSVFLSATSNNAWFIQVQTNTDVSPGVLRMSLTQDILTSYSISIRFH